MNISHRIEKLRNQDIEGAIRELKLALKTNPDDPIAHNELSKAYFARNDTQLALREFKRTIFLYMKRGEMRQAVDEYLELHAEMPELMLDPPQQKKLAVALEQRAKTEFQQHSDPKEGQQQQQRLYAEAAFAYKQLIFHYRKTTKSLQHPNAVNALKRYIHLNLKHLQNPQEAEKAYNALLKSQAPLSQEEQQQLEKQIKVARQEAVKRDEQAKTAEVEKAKQAALMRQKAELASKRRAVRAKIPLRKRVKLLPAVDAPAKYPVPSVAPLEAGKVIPVAGGLDLKRLSEPPISFDDIYLLHVFQLQENTSGKRKKRRDMGLVASESLQDVLFVDLFLKGRSRPYRIASNRIAYPQFFSNLQSNSLDNFRQFLSYIISYLESLYLDQQTIHFLKTGKAVIFSDQEHIAIHEKILWKQLRGAVRFVCDHCFATYWADGNKSPANGAETACPNCKKPIFVEPLQLI